MISKFLYLDSSLETPILYIYEFSKFINFKIILQYHVVSIKYCFYKNILFNQFMQRSYIWKISSLQILIFFFFLIWPTFKFLFFKMLLLQALDKQGKKRETNIFLFIYIYIFFFLVFSKSHHSTLHKIKKIKKMRSRESDFESPFSYPSFWLNHNNIYMYI